MFSISMGQYLCFPGPCLLSSPFSTNSAHTSGPRPTLTNFCPKVFAYAEIAAAGKDIYLRQTKITNFRTCPMTLRLSLTASRHKALFGVVCWQIRIYRLHNCLPIKMVVSQVRSEPGL